MTTSAVPTNPAAPHSLPWFVTPPGGTDTLYNITTAAVIITVILLGVAFFWLHSLPERMGHKKLQFEVVAVLGLISLFTHQHIFWIIGLLLAMVEIPDVVSPLRRIAESAEKIAGVKPEVMDADAKPETSGTVRSNTPNSPGAAAQSEAPAAADTKE
jgi:hypothetical protein